MSSGQIVRRRRNGCICGGAAIPLAVLCVFDCPTILAMARLVSLDWITHRIF
jgi:hypothetical protein